MTNAESRTKAIVVHTTPNRQQFLRIVAAEAGMTISSFTEKLITEALSKVEKADNPFIDAKNKQ
ncbi:hypothetical protein RG620_001978 [Acinetobacter baumannii]|nr:hypothetical protein [Acinetobacter baumannii]ELB2633608.1 hypothetical protein [Acinetobacter baumannii]